MTLRLLGGLTTDEIARAFLVPELDRGAAASSRAKRTPLDEEGPVRGAAGRRAGAARLSSVLEVIYLDLQRGLLGDRRRRLDAARPVRGRAAAGAGAGRADAARTARCTGLVALMEIQASRSAARAGPSG